MKNLIINELRKTDHDFSTRRATTLLGNRVKTVTELESLSCLVIINPTKSWAFYDSSLKRLYLRHKNIQIDFFA